MIQQTSLLLGVLSLKVLVEALSFFFNFKQIETTQL